jgi:DNA-binding NarL/FixJ family response regulator
MSVAGRCRVVQGRLAASNQEREREIGMSRQLTKITDWPVRSCDAPSQNRVGDALVAKGGRRVKPDGKRATKASRPLPGAEASPLRVALLDGDARWHECFRAQAQAHIPDWQLDWHTHGELAWPKLRATPPQLVLLERTLPDGCGFEWLRRCKRHWPEIPVVILTTQGCGKTLWEVMRAGAHGYWVKDGNAAGLVKQLRAVQAGKALLCDQAARLLLEAFAMKQRPATQWGLTRREEEVVAALCRKLSNKEIACELGLSAATVHAHLDRIFKKLNVHNRAEAMQKFSQHLSGGVKLPGANYTKGLDHFWRIAVNLNTCFPWRKSHPSSHKTK